MAKRISEKQASRPDEDSPEWTPEMVARARRGLDVVAETFGPSFAETLRRMGRPRKEDKKVNQTLRLDPDVIEAFRSTGPGWHGRINDVLRAHLPRRD